MRSQLDREIRKAYAAGRQEARFWSRVERRLDGCWQWTGPQDHGGYGRISSIRVHRYAYELLVAPIPEGLTIDHLCQNRLCVNPAHLEPVTMIENIRRGVVNRGLTVRS